MKFILLGILLFGCAKDSVIKVNLEEGNIPIKFNFIVNYPSEKNKLVEKNLSPKNFFWERYLTNINKTNFYIDTISDINLGVNEDINQLEDLLYFDEVDNKELFSITRFTKTKLDRIQPTYINITSYNKLIYDEGDSFILNLNFETYSEYCYVIEDDPLSCMNFLVTKEYQDKILSKFNQILKTKIQENLLIELKMAKDEQISFGKNDNIKVKINCKLDESKIDQNVFYDYSEIHIRITDMIYCENSSIEINLPMKIPKDN